VQAVVWIVRLMLVAVLASLTYAPAMAFALSAPCSGPHYPGHHAAAVSDDHAAPTLAGHHGQADAAPCCATACVAAILPSAPDFAVTIIAFRASRRRRARFGALPPARSTRRHVSTSTPEKTSTATSVLHPVSNSPAAAARAGRDGEHR
jgi:hypothetical protein